MTSTTRMLAILLVFISPLAAQQVQLEPLIESGLNQPVVITNSGDGTGRLFIVEQVGVIRIFRDGRLLPVPFLDIRGIVTSGGERGLLGLAFHPDYANNGRFFVNYTRVSGGQLETVIAEYHVSAQDPDLADPQGEEVLTFDQPFGNHNGGDLAFGSDGYLYVTSGDGGSGGDPQGHGQRLNTLLGKILRIDVDAGDPFAIPPDNPFISTPGARPEIWAYGLRNPWRMSFDRSSGHLFTGDVGQDTWEEVDLIERGGNYGWNVTEGPDCFPPAGPQNCDRSGLEDPITFYDRIEGRSITGGYVYRGPARTALWGSYIFGDFITGQVWSLRQDADGQWVRERLLQTGRNISAFGEDQAGNLYLVDYSGSIWKLEFQEADAVRAYAQLALGGGFSDILLLSNRSQSPWSGRLLLRQGDGEPWSTPWSLNGELRTGFDEIEVQLPAHGSRRIEIGGDEEARDGYLLISAQPGSSLQDLAVSFFYNFRNTQGLVDSTASLSSSLSSQYRFPVERSAGVDTGVAVAAFPGLRPTTIQYTLYDQQGAEVERLQRAFTGHSADFFSELFSNLPESFVGQVEINADLPVAITVLRQELSAGGFQLTTIPAEQ